VKITMANVKELLKIRHDVKKRKPKFQRQDVNKKKRLSNNSGWRAPKGSQSKMRLGKRGHPSKVNLGYGSPSKIKGLLRNGLVISLVSNVSDLEKLDKKNHVCVIRSGVGAKKRLEIISKAKEAGIIVYNYKDSNAFVKSVMEEIEKRKKARLERKAKKKESAKKAEKTEKAEKSKEEGASSKDIKDAKGSATANSKSKKTENMDVAFAKPSSEEIPEDEKTKEKKDWDKLLTQKS